MSSRKYAPSSVASTWKLRVLPSCLIAVIPAGIESWRKAALLEKISARKRAAGSSGASTVVASVRTAMPPLPSSTVSLAVGVPAAVYVLLALAPLASIVPSLSKSHRYVRLSPSASVAAAEKSTGSGAMPKDCDAVADEITGSAFAPVPGTHVGSGGTFGPSSVNQSNVGVTVVVAALESAKKPTFALAGRNCDVRPAWVHVWLSVEYAPVRLVPSHVMRR